MFAGNSHHDKVCERPSKLIFPFKVYSDAKEIVAIHTKFRFKVIEANNLRITADVSKLKMLHFQDILDDLKAKQEAHDSKVAELQIALGEEEENLRLAKADYEVRTYLFLVESIFNG
jgi:hypothetical protein